MAAAAAAVVAAAAASPPATVLHASVMQIRRHAKTLGIQEM